MKVKSKDIAKALGLSTATVSLTINKKPGVNQETRDRVLQYIANIEYEEYGFLQKPSPQREGSIVLLEYYKNGIILDRAKETPTNTWQQMERVVIQAGYQFIVSTYYEKTKKMEALINHWKAKQVKGIYIMGAEMNKNDIYPFLKLGIPIVVGDNNFYEQGIDSFMIDNREGICRAVEHLVDKGHSFIVYLAENINIFNFNERRKAFVKEMERRECGEASHRILNLGTTVEEVYQLAISYLNQEGRRPTAFVLESSVISLGVSKDLMEKGIRIPRDISLIGFDALPPISLFGFELTLIKGTHTRRHIAAIKHLLRHMEEEKTEIIRIYYKTKLLEGNSVFDKTKYIYKNSRDV